MTNLQTTKIERTAQELRQRILDGRYHIGQRLPAETELAEELQVSRQTLRTVLSRLQQSNLILTVPRSGSYVHNPQARTIIGPMVPPGALPYAGLLKSLHATQTETRFLEPPLVISADEALASTLGLKVGTELVRHARLCSVNSRPARLIESYYPATVFTDFPNLESNPLHRLLLQASAPPYSAFERFRSRMPSQQEADVLGQSRTQAVIDVTRWIWSAETLFAYTHIVANAATHEYTYVYTEANREDLRGKILSDA